MPWGRRGNRRRPACVKAGMDDIDREAIRAEGFNPDDPAMVTAIDLVRWELSVIRTLAGHLIFCR